MLVLARKVGQSIIIGGSIEITVIEVRGEQVRLGIAAPRTVTVHRKELLERDKSAGVGDEPSESSKDAPEPSDG
jgi:carbon storage regulator